MDAASKHLLLVDDEPKNLDLLEMCLEPLGHRLTRATSGAEALDIFARGGIDLLLLDIMMPGVDGLEVLRSLRRGERARHVPVILVTAVADRERRVRGLELGADEFLEKPLDRSVLTARVNMLLRLQCASDLVLQRNAQLETLQRAQRDLTNFIVHDMKSPISVIAVNLSWVRDHLTEVADVAEALDDSVNASVQLEEMVMQLLLVSSLENEDGLPLRREAVALAALAGEVLRSRGRALDEAGIVVVVEGDASVEVPVDRAMFRRVCENIVDNALRFTPRQGRIGVRVARSAKGVELTISNTGAAIPEEERKVLFDKFARGKSAAGTNFGLGLHFCQLAARAHGGDIRATATPEWPVSFVVDLPVP